MIYQAWKNGCTFDSWSDLFKEDAWHKAIEESGTEPAYYCYRERTKDEVLPWDHIDVGVTKNFLYREYQRAQAGEVTPHCRQKCSGCGIMALSKAGVCYETREEGQA